MHFPAIKRDAFLLGSQRGSPGLSFISSIMKINSNGKDRGKEGRLRLPPTPQLRACRSTASPLHSEEAGSHYILIMSVIYLQPIFPSESTQ